MQAKSLPLFARVIMIEKLVLGDLLASKELACCGKLSVECMCSARCGRGKRTDSVPRLRN